MDPALIINRLDTLVITARLECERAGRSLQRNVHLTSPSLSRTISSSRNKLTELQRLHFTDDELGWWQRECEAGNITACLLIGTMLQTGTYFEMDYSTGTRIISNPIHQLTTVVRRIPDVRIAANNVETEMETVEAVLEAARCSVSSASETDAETILHLGDSLAQVTMETIS